jgi:hypothetical protein
VDFLVLGLEAEGLHGNAELVLINGAGSISVEQIEGFLNLLLLVSCGGLGLSILYYTLCLYTLPHKLPFSCFKTLRLD